MSKHQKRKGSDVMAKVSTNVSIDAETKAQAQELLADLGLDLSTAINIFLRQMVRENAIPFEVRRKAEGGTTPDASPDRGKV